MILTLRLGVCACVCLSTSLSGVRLGVRLAVCLAGVRLAGVCLVGYLAVAVLDCMCGERYACVSCGEEWCVLCARSVTRGVVTRLSA